jgi:hypothetical protein
MPIHRRTPDRAYRRTTSSVRPTPPRSHSDPSHSRCCVDQLNSPSAGVVVVDQLAGSHWMSGAVSVLQRDPQRDENQIGAFVGGDMPGHDPLGEHVDDEGDVAKSGPGRSTCCSNTLTRSPTGLEVAKLFRSAGATDDATLRLLALGLCDAAQVVRTWTSHASRMSSSGRQRCC